VVSAIFSVEYLIPQKY